MIVYIAGKMRGIPYYNFPAFDAKAAELRAAGHEVLNPADMDRAAGFDPHKRDWPSNYTWNQEPPDFDYSHCIERDLQAVKSCDAIYMLPGWENSKGATAERAVALWMGKKVMGEVAGSVRTFASGATRDSDDGKIDFDGFYSVGVMRRFGEYMNKHRRQPDGKLRASDNWQRGIPRTQYRKSAWRHFLEWVEAHQAGHDTTEPAMALLFNIQGDTHEALKGVPCP